MQQKQKPARRREDCFDCLYWLGGYGCALGDAPCPYAESAIEAAPNAPPGRCEDCPYAMLANSEFVVLLRQTKDIDSVAELYGLSEPQKNYLLLARPGQGILKLGNSLIPFENEYPKNKTYQLLTTKPGEMEQ